MDKKIQSKIDEVMDWFNFGEVAGILHHMGPKRFPPHYDAQVEVIEAKLRGHIRERLIRVSEQKPSEFYSEETAGFRVVRYTVNGVMDFDVEFIPEKWSTGE